jgi:hypothetical protein
MIGPEYLFFIVLSSVFLIIYGMLITVPVLGMLMTKPELDYIKKTFVYLVLGLVVFSLFALFGSIAKYINIYVLYFGIIAYCILFTIAFIRLRNRRKNVSGNKYLSKRVNNVRR